MEPVRYAQHIPVNVIARMLGFPLEDSDLFRQFVHDALVMVNASAEEWAQLEAALDHYVDAQIAEHADHPECQDLTSSLMNVEIGGSKLPHARVRGMIDLLLVAGVDTTWSAIGSSLWQLAKLARLELRIAVQEFVRRFPRFELADAAAVTWSVGQIRRPRDLPIRVLLRAAD